MWDAERKNGELSSEPRVMLSAGGVVSVLLISTVAMVFGVLLALRLGNTVHSPQVVRVSLGAHGFTPAAVEIQDGRPVEIWVFRRDAIPCTDSVVLEDFNLSKSLTPHKATVMAFTPNRQGNYTLRCGMGCWKTILKSRDEEVVTLPVFFE